MVRATVQRRSGQPVNALAFVRSSPGRTLRRPTEKLNASFKPRFANGPTPAPIRTRISDRRSCSTGSEREKPGELIHLDIKKLGRIGSVGTASLGDILAR